MIQLRSYQIEGLKMLQEAILGGYTSILWVYPTGAGKSTVASAYVKHCVNKGQRVLFAVHSKELVNQFADRLWDQFAVSSGIVMAGVKPDYSAPVQCCSVMSLVKRFEKLSDNGFVPDVVIIDEAHRSKANTYQKILEVYPNAITIGLTATPERADGRGLDHFQKIVHPVKTGYLISQGHLVPTKIFRPETLVDLTGVGTRAGDFDTGQAFERFNDKGNYHGVVNMYLKLAKGKKAICFNTNVEHSQTMNQYFNDAGIVSLHIDGKTKKKERERSLQMFRDGDVQLLNNVGVYTEGLDVPDIEVLILNLATKSPTRYVQMAGRVLRPWTYPDGSKKEVGLILDFGGNGERHGYVEDYDIIPFTLEGRKKLSITGEAEKLKSCPECMCMNYANASTCSECGHLFVAKEVEVKISDTKSMVLLEREAALISKLQSITDHKKASVLPIQYLRLYGMLHEYKKGWACYAAIKQSHLYAPKDDKGNFITSEFPYSQVDFLIKMEELIHGTDRFIERVFGN